MKIPMPQKLIPFAIFFFSLLSAYYFYKTVDALTSGSITADKRYHQAEVILAEDPQTFYLNLTLFIIGFAAPAWVAYILYRQRRSNRN
ncbi:hypothetical protein [Brucella gallinifaecis]|uniref:hypothetical protein n=1 Tax=Brucella gallinifaecis TaxID=215590 RepID=UPI0023620623|nr:hypothetical protein [Brucella gallinifaecis]